MKAKKTTRKAAARPAPARRSIPERYFALLEGHLARPRKGTLAAAAELGRDLALAGLPPEGIRELHAEALRRLDSDFEDMSPSAFAERTAAPLMELMMAYGSASPEQLDQAGRAEDAVRESEARFRDLFEQSPIGIWEEDYSAVKPIIDRLRKKGVRDFRRYFREHPEVISQIAKAIKVIDVNQALLDLYRVPDKETYLRAVAEPARINHWLGFYEEELAALAEGEDRVVLEYLDKAFDGSDIVIRTVTHIGEAYKDSWARIVSTVEDITERRWAEEALRESEASYRELFEQSPVSIWEEDWSAVKKMLDGLARRGVRDWREYFRRRPDQVRKANDLIPVVEVSQATLDIYRSPSKEAIIDATLADKMSPEEFEAFREHLTAFAEGKTRFDFEVKEPALDGSEIVTYKHAVIPPKYHGDWARVIYAITDITEQKRAEEARREAERRLADIAANIPGSIFRRVLHTDGKISFPYTTIETIHGLDPKAVMEDPDVFIDAIHPDDRGKWHKAVRASAKRLERFDFEMRLITPSGETRWVQAMAQPHRLDNGDVVWDGVMVDITERKRGEVALRESETRHRELFEQSPIGIWEEDYSAVKPMIDRLRKKGVRDFRRYFREHPGVFRKIVQAIKVIDVNPALLDLYRAPNKDLLLEVASDPSRIEKLGSFYEQELAALAAGERRVVVEHLDKAYDGSDIVVRVITHIGEAYKDSWARVVSTTEDITERKRAEDALRESEGRFRSLAANLPGVVFQRRLTSDGRLVYTYVSPGMRELYGIEPEKVIADSSAFLQVLPAEEQGRFLAALKHSARTLSPMDLELRVVSADGGTQWQRTISRPFRRESGEVVWDGVAIDITEQKRAEDALRESEARYRELFELSPDAIMVHQDGKFVFVNPAGVRLFGAERPEQLIGKPALDIVHPDFRDVARERIRQVIETEKRVSLVEEKFLRLDGTAFDAEVSGTSSHYKGRPAVQVIIRDITERKRAEEAVRESEARFRSLFEQSPIGVLEEDYSAVKLIIDRLRGQGVRDFRRYFREHPRVLRQAINAIKIIDVNQALLDAYGAPDKETYLRVAEEPARITQWMGFYEQELAALAAGETRFALEYADKAFDGSDIVIRTITHIGEAHKESWARVVSTTEDITERRRAEEALRESEARYRTLFELSPLGIWEEDYSAVKPMIDRLRKKGVRDFRRYFREHPRVLRQAVEAIKNTDINQAILDIYRAPDKEAFLQAVANPSRMENWGGFYEQELAALAAGARRVVLEETEKALDGSDVVIRSITNIGAAYKDSWMQVVTTTEDITGRRRAEDALRESESRHRDLFEQSPIGVWEEDYSGAKRIVDRLRKEGVRDFRRYFREHPRVLRQAINAIKIIDVNQALLDIYRAPDKETFVQWDENPARIDSWMSFYEQGLAALAAGETRFALEHADKAFDGSDIVTRTITHIGEAYKESWARVVSTAEDITERRRAEEALRRSEVFNRAVLDNVADAIITIGEDDKILSFSGPAERIFGYSAGEAIGKNVSLLTPRPKQKQQRARAWIRAYLPAEGSKPASSEPRRITACRKNGVVFPMELSVRQTVSEGKPLYIAVARDITEREAMQAQLIQAEKLSTLGGMAAGIAHELNQPLNIIRMAADSSLMLIEDGDADLDYQKEQLALIGGQTQRMAGIIDHMRIFSRKDDMGAEPFDASASVRNALGLVHEAIHLADIRVAAKVPEHCRHVLGHAVQLEQVMVSLLTNATDAILAHPVPARDRLRGKQRGRITVNLVDDKTSHWIWIIISDTGGGIPDDVIGHIFEPFYTTKELGKGTGLGLSVAYGIVTAMGGRIDVWNTAKGARFQIALPVAGRGPRGATPPPAPPWGSRLGGLR